MRRYLGLRDELRPKDGTVRFPYERGTKKFDFFTTFRKMATAGAVGNVVDGELKGNQYTV